MKKVFCLIIAAIVFLPVHSQNVDDSIDFSRSQVKDFGGFILDMGTMLNAESLEIPLMLPSLGYLAPLDGSVSPYQINKDAYQLNSSLNYLGGLHYFSPHLSTLSILYPGYGNGPVQWQGASYKLNNGIRINTYGEYDADGNKVYNPSALPWQKNNFNAAFEVKSPNGKFGIKVEVHGGRNYAY